MVQNRKFDITFLMLAIISSIGIIALTISYFFGMLLFYLIVFKWLVLIICISFSITLIITVYRWRKSGFKKNQFVIFLHLIVLALLFIIWSDNSGIFKSKQILSAYLQDDLSRIDLVLRNNGRFEMTSSALAISEKVKGDYKINNDTIVFSKNPYTNDFIPRKVLLNRDKHRIYFQKDENGYFIQRDEFAAYFTIEHDDIK